MFKLDNETLFDQSRGLLNKRTQRHFPERKVRRCVGGFVRHRRIGAFGPPAILLIPVLSRSRAAPRSQSGPYLCSKRGPTWFPAHLFQVQHIEVVSLRKMEPLRKPDIKFTQVT